jgi:hypothetical protein
LHPEWNPGVVEQQIGRVDRVGSRWERLFRETTQDVSIEDLPRIEIKALVFRGTYDEHNWEVLKTRWDALRSQLHGEVIMAEGDIEDSESEAILREISAYAPSFSPPL